MEITSSVFKNGEEIPMRYTCDGEYINPPLQISAVPENTKSLSLIVEDPDAPVGLWIDWMIWDIEPNTKQIPSGTTTIGTVGKNSSNNNDWDDICPPDREHRYFFKLFALNTKLGLNPEKTTKDNLYNAMKKHIIEKAELMGRYNLVKNS